MSKYVPTPQEMACSAMNCYIAKVSVMYYPRATLEKYSKTNKRMTDLYGYTFHAIEDADKALVDRALVEYKDMSDWSAFTKEQWQAAVEWNASR